MSVVRDRVVEAVSYLVLLAAWQLAAIAYSSPWLVGPLEIARVFADKVFLAKLVDAYLLTAMRALTGFALGLVAGLGLGVLAGMVALRLGGVLEKLSAIIASVPSVAWIPLLIALLGTDEFRLPVAASFLCSFPPILYQVFSALRSVDPEEVAVAQTLGAEGMYLWRTIILPKVLEKLFPAVKVESVMTWKTVFAAEMVAVPSGLGYLAMLYADLLDVAHVAAIVFVLTATVAVFVSLASRFEKRVLAKRGLGERSWQSISMYAAREY
ncbi:hypothetical protein PYJP_00420 [Pyrofollis japonicus]|nr:hypothetical protein PYJP_00420 [Pyrofollis japonicus]